MRQHLPHTCADRDLNASPAAHSIAASTRVWPFAAGEPSRSTCGAPISTGCIGFSILFGGLLARTFRSYRRDITSFDFLKIDDPKHWVNKHDILVLVVFMLVIDFGLLLAYGLAVDPGRDHTTREVDGVVVPRLQCTPNKNLPVIFTFGYKGLVALLLCYFAFRARNAPTRSPYSKHFSSPRCIFYVAIAMLIVSVIIGAIVVGKVGDDEIVHYILTSTGILIVTSFTVVMLVGMKVRRMKLFRVVDVVGNDRQQLLARLRDQNVDLVRVSYLRGLAKADKPLRCADELDEEGRSQLEESLVRSDELNSSLEWLSLYAVSWHWETKDNPGTQQLVELMKVLDQRIGGQRLASDADLVFVDVVSLTRNKLIARADDQRAQAPAGGCGLCRWWQRASSSTAPADGEPSRMARYDKAFKGLNYFLFTTPLVRSIVLPIKRGGAAAASVQQLSLSEPKAHAGGVALVVALQCAAFCQQVLNLNHELVEKLINERIEQRINHGGGSERRWLSPLQELSLISIASSSHPDAAAEPSCSRVHPGEMSENTWVKQVVKKAETVLHSEGWKKAVQPVSCDRAGFTKLCEDANLSWLKVAYVWHIAPPDKETSGPYPRKQDLPRGACYHGLPPRDDPDTRQRVRRFVVTYPWASQCHPSPSGRKMHELAKQLEELKAKPTDAVFMDFCSLPQHLECDAGELKGTAESHRIYREKLQLDEGDGKAMILKRTPVEERQFKVALSEMTRLYCFKDCEVIVLPRVEDAADFPGGKDAWGAINAREYKLRGWAFTEFSTARIARRIVNKSDSDVRKLLDDEDHWPNDLITYSDKMKERTDELDEEGQKQDLIRFTAKGDREKVKYIFFRMAYDVTGRRAKRAPQGVQKERSVPWPMFATGRPMVSAARTSSTIRVGPFQATSEEGASSRGVRGGQQAKVAPTPITVEEVDEPAEVTA